MGITTQMSMGEEELGEELPCDFFSDEKLLGSRWQPLSAKEHLDLDLDVTDFAALTTSVDAHCEPTLTHEKLVEHNYEYQRLDIRGWRCSISLHIYSRPTRLATVIWVSIAVNYHTNHGIKGSFGP